MLSQVPGRCRAQCRARFARRYFRPEPSPGRIHMRQSQESEATTASALLRRQFRCKLSDEERRRAWCVHFYLSEEPLSSEG